MVSSLSSYRKIFRLFFVIFSLYLMGDAFFRWDGFRYYGTFSEFLPSIALITILWSITVALFAVLVWLPIRVIECFSLRLRWKVRAEHLLLFIGIFVLLGVTIWVGKRYIWKDVETSLQFKQVVFFANALAAIFFTWFFRNKSERWINFIHERITPLVWLFGIWLLVSVPLVAYHTWGKQTDKVVTQIIPQPPIADKNRPNIILVIFDALTARDMSAYDYHRPTTPFITEWSKEASLFTRLEAEDNMTTPTTASLMTGKRIWTHQTYHTKGSKPVRSDIESLPLLLKNNGYYTVAFIVNYVTSVKILGISNGFEIAPHPNEFHVSISLFESIDKLLNQLFANKIRLYDWFIKGDFIMYRLMRTLSRNVSDTIVPPEKAFNRFLQVIDDSPPEPFFAWIHLLPPHDPYLSPEPYMGMFDSSPELRTYKSQEKVWLGIGWEHEFKQEEQPTIDIMRARYDELIRYCDKQFEDFIKQLIIRNKLKNTVVILSSDHGDSFEHNYLGHAGPHLYEQVTHIPLIIKEPNQTEGRIINDLVEQIDIPPTILDLANIPVPSWMEGRSLIPLMRGKKLSMRPAFSMNFEANPSRGHQISKGTIAVWEGDYKLIHYLEDEKSLLFNLKEDPDELNNLIDREPEIGQHLLTLIKDNLKKANEKIDSGI